ncbi:MAG: hypothetical protein ACJ8J0_25400 [Longimicrobiaceae bacterium]
MAAADAEARPQPEAVGLSERSDVAVPGLRLAAKNLESIGRSIGSHEVGDRVLGSPGPAEELYGPLGDPLLPDVDVLSGFGLVDELFLENQGQGSSAPVTSCEQASASGQEANA